jgi:hypothetical protein
MDWNRLLAQFHRIVEAVRTKDQPLSCWAEVLEITGQSSNEALVTLDVDSDIDALTKQIAHLLQANPLPAEVAFFWFGLCDLLIGDKEVEGFYVSGLRGTGPDDHSQSTVYPSEKAHWLESRVLNGIKDALKQIERIALDAGRKRPEQYHILDYSVMFGAAALLTKFAIEPLNLRTVAVYVGFDSGDWALVNTPASTTNRAWPIVPTKRIDASSLDLS